MSSKVTAQQAVSRQYEKENRALAVWKRLRTNPGAVIGLIILIIMVLLMIYSFLFISYEEIYTIDSKNRFSPPSSEHIFGTDEMGRDLAKRIIYGSRYSLAVAFGAVAIGVIIGTFLGSIAGYFGGWVDNLIMRISDIMSSIPGILLGMVIVTILGPNLLNLLIAVGVTNIAGFIRMARASVLTTKSNEYVESARAIGMSEFRIIFTQVLPNSLSPLIVTATARMATSILAAAGLSFLGFGIAAPKPDRKSVV